jgi:4-alpha-glucanotransferase
LPIWLEDRINPSNLHLIAVFSAPWGTRSRDLDAMVHDTLEALVDLMEERPEARLAMRLDGNLLEHIEAEHGHLADRLAGLATAGNVELVGGGFYAPILALLPWRDAVGQLEMTAGYLERRSGVRPRGAWLDEGVWEPRLAEVLETAGVTWTALDESALRAAAVDGVVDGHYVTEHAGRPLAVLPIDRGLRLALVAGSASRFITAVVDRSAALGRSCTMTWAGDASLLARGGDAATLHALCDAVAARSDVEWALPAESVERASPNGRVYLASGVAPELAAQTVAPWRLDGWHRRRAALIAAGDDAATAEEWLRGGIWQAFLARYGEIDRMHKRSLEVSRRFAAVERVMRNGGFRAISQLVRPRRALYRGQAGAAFGWGSRAGMHDADLRAAIYATLVEAEVAAEALVRDGAPYLEVSLRDVHAELETAVLVRSRSLRLVVRPSIGGTLAALEWLGDCVALHDVLTRRLEFGQPPGGVADGHERAWLHDRFLPPDVLPAQWMDDVGERGDFLDRRYRTVGVNSRGRGADERVDILLAADGKLAEDAGPVAVSLVKTIRVEASGCTVYVRWALEFDRALTQSVDFAVECNLSFASAVVDEGWIQTPDGERHRCDATIVGAAGSTLRFGLTARGAVGYVHADAPVRFDTAPIYTLAMPVGKPANRAFQGSALMVRLNLAAGTQLAKLSLEIAPQPVHGAREETDD